MTIKFHKTLEESTETKKHIKVMLCFDDDGDEVTLRVEDETGKGQNVCAINADGRLEIIYLDPSYAADLGIQRNQATGGICVDT